MLLEYFIEKWVKLTGKPFKYCADDAVWCLFSLPSCYLEDPVQHNYDLDN